MKFLTQSVRKMLQRTTRQLSSQGTARKRFQKQLRIEQLEDRRLLAAIYPNDSGFVQQWELNNTGQTGGQYDADLDAPEAWSITTGSMATVVAILDLGVDYTDPDLYLNIWLNQNEIPAGIAASLTDSDSDELITFRDLNAAANASYVSDLNGNGYRDGGDLLRDVRWANGIDEDGNGKIDDLIGWDFHNNDNDPKPEISGGVYQTHGTDMAKIIGAMTNNGVGTAGINWKVRLVPERIRSIGGSTTDLINSNAAAALDYAVALGAPISNNSWRAEGGGYIYSQELYDAISRARLAGHLVVAAAGNEGSNNDVRPFYPASLDLDNIISATVDEFPGLPNTNWGPISVDLGAFPGGSSGASAQTSAVAALLKTLHSDWTYTQIKNQILSTVEPTAWLSGKTVTGGRLNAAKAVGYVPPNTKFYIVNDGSPDRTYEYSATGSAIENYSINSGNTQPRGAASNVAGDTVWVADKNRKVYVYNIGGGLVGSWSAGTLATNALVEGVATNGTDVWIVDSKSDKIFRYTGAASRTSGSQNAVSSFSLNSSNTNPKGIVTDGTYLWVVNDSTTDKVFKYTTGGSLLGSWTIDSANKTPTGLTIDPTGASQSIWIVDSGTDKVYEYTGARSRTNGSQSAAANPFALAAGNTNPQGIADPPPASSMLANSNAMVDSNDKRNVAGVGAVPTLSIYTTSSRISDTTLPRIQTTVHNTDDFMSDLGRFLQMPQAPATIAWTSPVVSRESMDPSESDDLQTAEENINDLIGLVANNVWN